MFHVQESSVHSLRASLPGNFKGLKLSKFESISDNFRLCDGYQRTNPFSLKLRFESKVNEVFNIPGKYFFFREVVTLKLDAVTFDPNNKYC